MKQNNIGDICLRRIIYMITEQEFKNNTNWKMSYEEYKKCYCPECSRNECPHRNSFRRVPRIDGGLGLCSNLKNNG